MKNSEHDYLTVKQLNELSEYAPDGLVFLTDQITGEVSAIPLADGITIDEVWHIRVEGDDIVAPKHAIIEMYEDTEYMLVKSYETGVIF